jgi:hypothetical protein
LAKKDNIVKATVIIISKPHPTPSMKTSTEQLLQLNSLVSKLLDSLAF